MIDLTVMYPAQANSPSTTTLGDISSTDTQVMVADASVLPDVPFLLTFGYDMSRAETVLVTAKTSNALTIIRGVDGIALLWISGTKCARIFTAKDLNDLQKNIGALNTGKSDNDHTHTPDSVGADPSGTAAAAVGTHNSSPVAHPGVFDAAGAASSAVSAHDAAAAPHVGKFDTSGTAVSAVASHNDNAATHPDIRASLENKSDVSHTHTPAQVGSDPAGTAINAVNTHNASANAHAGKFDSAGAAAAVQANLDALIARSSGITYYSHFFGVNPFKYRIEILTTQSWIVPDDVYFVDVWMVGGGGGGGMAPSADLHAGGGGGGGYCYMLHRRQVSPGESIGVFIGAGGTGSTAVNQPAAAGGSTSFKGVVAPGGSGGSSVAGGSGGSGGAFGFANGGVRGDNGFIWSIDRAGLEYGSGSSAGSGTGSMTTVDPYSGQVYSGGSPRPDMSFYGPQNITPQSLGGAGLQGENGYPNTGGGGGGGGGSFGAGGPAGNGGSGICVIYYNTGISG